MNYKKWIYSGVAIFIGSVVAGILVPFWGISSSFKALEKAETAGIETVQGGIEWALYSTVFFIVTALVGLVLVVVGSVKAYRYSKSNSEGSQP
jgi:uncharacterized membrane protein